jgi:hypothetical protein
VLPDLIPPGDLAEMRGALAPALDAELYGRNDFEGHRTQRVYSLVAQAPVFTALVEHPRVLALCDAFLEPNYLLIASQAIRILPGETPQPFHTDDSLYHIARDPVIDFATVPDAQRIPRPKGARPAWLHGELRDVVMPAGAGIAFLGTLVHRGSENRSDRPRLALSNQYCQPWARQQENYCLSVPREQARAMSPRVQELLGYSVHPPFIGPRERLASAPRPRRVDRLRSPERIHASAVTDTAGAAHAEKTVGRAGRDLPWRRGGTSR